MLPQITSVSLPSTRWANLPVSAVDDPIDAARVEWSRQRHDWVAACAARLSQLRPGEDQDFIASVADDMWVDVGTFDPIVAAEMEHEAWPWND